MNITINGNVTINGNITNKENLSLRQLRSILPSTKDVKTPTRVWVREHLDSDQVFFSREYGNGDKLVVFTNGFYCYGNENWTVLRWMVSPACTTRPTKTADLSIWKKRNFWMTASSVPLGRMRFGS